MHKKLENKEYRKLITLLTIIVITIYIGWRICFTLPVGYGIVTLICGIIMLLCEVITVIETFMHLVTSIDSSEPELPVIPKEWYPEIDVFIATHNEPEELLYKTINGCKHMIYPDKSKVHIWLCDDGNRETISRLAKRMGIGYHGLANNKLAKAGNLNNALSKTNAPLIVTFDADMIPTRNFLLKTVPYFFLPKLKKLEDGSWVERTEDEIDNDYKIGFIQTAQSFYNADLFQFNLYSEDKIPNEQDYFFKEVNVSRNKYNTPIYAGSNTVISREALEVVGGITTGTITEDFETGLHIQEAGYRCYAVAKDVAHGLAPNSVDSLIKQRERWGRGCIFSLKRAKILRNKKFPLISRFSYFLCYLYWWSFMRRFVFILAPIIFALFNIPVIICETWQIFVFWLPSYLFTIIATRAVSSQIRNLKWSIIIDTILFPYLVVPIFMEAIGIHKKEFHVTDKNTALDVNNDYILTLPYIIMAVVSSISIVEVIRKIIEYESLGPIVILFWLMVNFFALIMSIFFMIGRRNMRMYERYFVKIPVCIKLDKEVYGETVDVSEGGFCVILKKPYDIPTDTEVDIELYTNAYKALVKAKIVHASKRKKSWKYSFEIISIDEYNKAEYFQLVYDREPSLPNKIEKTDSIFSNVKDNIKNRRLNGSNTESRRKSQRIAVNQYLYSTTDKKYYVENYNFKYLLIRSELSSDDIDKELKIFIDKENTELLFELEYERMIDEGKHLYLIKNHTELAFEEALEEIIEKWINEEEDKRIQ